MPNSKECVGCGKEYKNLRIHYHRNPEHKPKNWCECHECGERYKTLGQHWGASDCTKPEFSHKQHEMIAGILMGDGSIAYHYDNPTLHISVIKKEYLDYINKKFGNLALGVNKRSEAKELAKKNRDSGFSPDAKAENYSDIYRLTTTAHHELKQYADWYSTGKKVFPESIDLTPTTLKHWYCCDGTMDTWYGNKRIRISAGNEKNNKDKIRGYFSGANLPEPKLSCFESNSSQYNHTKMQIGFTVEETKEVFNYMGEPLPGFEYKWPDSGSR